MAEKKTYSTDKYGRITQVDRTYERADGKTETWHSDRYGHVTGKTVNDPETGESDHYERIGGGAFFGFLFAKR